MTRSQHRRRRFRRKVLRVGLLVLAVAAVTWTVTLMVMTGLNSGPSSEAAALNGAGSGLAEAWQWSVAALLAVFGLVFVLLFTGRRGKHF